MLTVHRFATRAAALPLTVTVLSLLAAAPIAAAPAQPKVGDCWLYASYADATETSVSPAKRVPCTQRHNAVTTSVAKLPSSVANPWKDVEAAAGKAGLKCDYRGYTAQEALALPMSRPLRIEGDIYVPSKAQWAAGERWARCDAIIPSAKALDDWPADLTAWSKDKKASGRCYDANPTTGALVRRCDGKETWTAPAWIKVPGATFPGRDALIAIANDKCAPLAKRQRQWDATFPKAANWQLGYRGVMCLVGPIKESI